MAIAFIAKHPHKIIPVIPQSISPDRGFSGHLKRLVWYNTSLNRQLHRYRFIFFSRNRRYLISKRPTNCSRPRPHSA